MPDDDQDEWPNDVDNCPSVANPEQHDRDHDGIGDECDSCPSTPNDGKNGQPGQDQCDVVSEAEPNDAEGHGQPITLSAAGRVLEVRGVVEAPTNGNQPFDRYAVMVPAHTMLRVRAVRSQPASLLEPAIVVSGGAYTVPRIADGLLSAERDVYFSEAGTYEIAVTDRRGLFDANPQGSAGDAYALAIQLEDVTPERVVPPLDGRLFTLPPGKVGVYTADLAASPRSRLETHTALGDGTSDFGLDTILVVESPSGMVTENDDLADGYLDSRLLFPLDQPSTVRIVLDYHRLYRVDLDDSATDVRLTIDQPPSDGELEPNDRPDLASALVFPGETAGEIGPPRPTAPDVDYYAIQARAGQVASFHALISNGSQIDPYIAIGQLHDGAWAPTFTNLDSSGIAARIDVIFPEDGTYQLVVGDQKNEAPPFHGGIQFDYHVFSEITGIQQVSTLTSTGTLSGTIDPGGRIIRHRLEPREPTLVVLDAGTTGTRDLEPYVHVYGPGAVGVLGEGSGRVLAFLPGPASYVAGVHNANKGAGGPTFTYALPATFFPLTPVAEVEPNDTAGTATPLGSPPAVGTGSLGAATDVDRYTVALAAGDRLDAKLGVGARGRTVALYAPGSSASTASAEGGLSGVNIAAAGTYVLEVTGAVGAYTLLVAR